MSYSIRQPNIFGRLGTEVGKGLAEQIPKEVDRSRLSSGLKQFEQDSATLTPIQQLARLSSIPGITPQMIQSFSELAKQQNARNSFNNNGLGNKQENGGQQRPQREPESVSSPNAAQKVANVPFGNPNQRPEQPRNNGPEVNRDQPLGNEQVVANNPLNPEFKTRQQWSPERKDQDISDDWDRHPTLTYDQIKQRSDDREARELSQPESAQAEYKRLEDTRNKLKNEFRDQLSTKLQKNPAKAGEVPSEIYKDITGENLVAIERAMEKDLATNPNGNINDVANKWSNKALDLAKTKDQLKTVEKGSFTDYLNPGKYGTTFEKLKNYQKIFKETGNTEELFNILKSNFDMSSEGAASISDPPTPKLTSYLKNVKHSPIFKGAETSRKHALEIEKLLTDDDSILAVARNLKEKDPMFNEDAFFRQLGEDQDHMGLTQRQKRELAEGSNQNIIPAWGDLWILGTRRDRL